MQLAGAHVLITGGSRGIGRELAARFAAAGAKLTLVARSQQPLQAAAAEVGGVALRADLSDPAAVAGLIERAESAGPVDVLVNNAGLGPVGRFTDLTAAELQELWQVNISAPAELTRQVLPGMLRRGQGRVVFLSSLSAHVTLPGLTAYSATKAAVSQLAEGLRAELAERGIGVTTAEVGDVDTEMYATVRDQPATAAAFDRMHRLRLLRPLTVAEVATGVVAAVAADRDSVVLPRRARSQWLFAKAPQRLANLLLPPGSQP